MKNTIKRPLADVLWEAANVHLRPCEGYYDSALSKFSCDAVRSETNHDTVKWVCAWMSRCMGFPKDAYDTFDLFDDFEEGNERQGVRYMWLLLAMHVAEDEGIMVEVAK